MSVHANNSIAAASSTTASADRATDHTIRYDTWVGYNSTWKYFKVTLARALMHLYTPALTPARFSRLSSQMWMDSTGVYIIRDRHNGDTSITQSISSVAPFLKSNMMDPSRPTRYAISRLPSGNHLSHRSLRHSSLQHGTLD